MATEIFWSAKGVNVCVEGFPKTYDTPLSLAIENI
jgi:hypothetical protein